MKTVLLCLVFPALTVALGAYFMSSYHPARHDLPQVPAYSCASASAALSNIDASGQIAPLCGTP